MELFRRNRLSGEEENGIHRLTVRLVMIEMCFILALCFIFLYIIYKSNIEQVYNDYLESEVLSFQKSFENFYKESKNLAVSIYMDEDIQKVLGDVTIGEEDVVCAARRLKQYLNVNIYTKSIYIYDSREHKLYSSTHFLPWDVDELSSFDPEILPIINQNQAFVVRTNPTDNRIMYTVVMRPLNNSGDAIVMNYYENVFSEFLRKESRIVVVDSDKKCFAGFSVALGTDLSGEKYIQKIYSSDSSAGILKEKVDRKEKMISYTKTNNFTIVNMEDTSVIVNNVIAPLLLWSILVGGFLCVIGIALIVYRKKLYKILHKILEKNENMKFKIGLNENSIKEIRLKNFFKMASLGKTLSSEDIRKMNFSIDVHEKVGILFLKIDDYKKFIRENSIKEQESITFSIVNVLKELLERETEFNLAVMENAEIIVIYSAAKCTAERLREVICKTQQVFRDSMDISISAFIGNEIDDITEIIHSYEKVLQLSEYRFYAGYNCVISEDYMEVYSKNKTEDFFDIRIQIITALKNMECEKAFGLFQDMIERLQVTTPSYMRGELLQLAFQLRQSVVGLFDRNVLTHEMYSVMFNNIIEAEILEDVIVLYKKLFEEIADNLSEKKDLKYDVLIKRVEKIVEENYGDINLSRKMVSEQIKINANYADSIFKKVYNKTISAYISDYRMEKAREFLKSTDYSVNEIAGRIGYSGGSHFIYNFKKKYGVTPNEYRGSIQGEK